MRQSTYDSKNTRPLRRRLPNRGQISLFISLALALVIILGLAMYMRRTRVTSVPKNDIPRLEADKASFSTLVTLCLKKETDEGIAYLGLGSSDLLASYILGRIDGCADVSTLIKQGYDVTQGPKSVDVRISEDAVIAQLTYPITLSQPTTQKEGALSQFIYQFRRKSEFPLKQNENGAVVGDHTFISPDGNLELVIQDGTAVTDTRGFKLDVGQVAFAMKERTSSDPASVIGGFIFDVSPHNARFSPPVTLRIKYPPDYLSQLPRNFVLSYYDPSAGWVNVPTTVDLASSSLEGRFSYLP